MRSLMLSMIVIGSGVTSVLGQEVPYGLSWGPVDNVPLPSLAVREENIDILLYRRERLPSGLRDTEEVILEICKNEGLQQIVWIGQPLTDSEARIKKEIIVSEGVRRYGSPKTGARGIIEWLVSRTAMLESPVSPGVRRIIMVSYGPDLVSCSDQHKILTGHTVKDHWLRFLPDLGSK